MADLRQGAVPFLLCLVMGLPASAWAFGARAASVAPPMPDSLFHRSHAGVEALHLGAYTPEVLAEQWLSAGAQARIQASRPAFSFEEPFSVEVIYRLNVDASRAWQAIVDCQGGDAEAARDAYYTGGRLCLHDEENEATRATVRAAAQRFQDFLVTSPYEGASIFRSNVKFPPLHPLLAEFATEFVYATWHHVQQRYQVRGVNIYHADEMTVRGDLSSCEYNPERLKALCAKDGDRVPQYWNRLYFNSLKLLYSMLDPARGCAHYGLWPNATLVASATLSVFSGRSYVGGGRAGAAYLPDDFLMATSPVRALPDAQMPSCWNGDTQTLLTQYSAQWMDPNRLAGKFETSVNYMAVVTAYMEEYYRLYVAWSR